ncbi:MAG: glycine--tRNA ligase subunit beta, partial [Gammaproteobacteria bacterium]|nr:glycine--tRNA ligase subunit beta [Gammaproteobacteria bacterium]
DLMSNMVYEFPDLQGIMGQYYAINSGENDMVAKAMNEVYMPRFAGDQLPETKTGLILAIAERVDTLTGIFGVGLIPTGAKDPFALRRASLGVLRLIIENNLSLDIADLIDASLSTFEDVDLDKDTKNNLLSFIAARELAFYQSQNISTQVIASVQSLNLTKPADVNKRVFAVEAFNKTPEAADLAEANKRVKNILEKSDFDPSKTKINPDLFEKDESVLFAAISDLASVVEDFNSKSEYQSSLDKLANIKVAVNQFFDSTMINADDENIRQNRLALIYQLRQLFIGIADISLLQK